MAREIERKYLVTGEYKSFSTKVIRITQGYLSSVPERSVRIRITGDRGFITVKGVGNASGMSRYEWEKEISLADAGELLSICEPGLIDKTRYLVPAGQFVFEVDEFHGDNLGLVIAEIELPSEQAAFEIPSWLGREITGDLRYYNVMLAKHPFTTWP